METKQQQKQKTHFYVEKSKFSYIDIVTATMCAQILQTVFIIVKSVSPHYLKITLVTKQAEK